MPQTGNLPPGVPSPKETLGYQIIRWCKEYIRTPDGERAGEPWEFTDEQLRFVLWFYSIKPDGRWAYSAGTLRRAKGWGPAQDSSPRISCDRCVLGALPVQSL